MSAGRFLFGRWAMIIESAAGTTTTGRGTPMLSITAEVIGLSSEPAEISSFFVDPL